MSNLKLGDRSIPFRVASPMLVNVKLNTQHYDTVYTIANHMNNLYPFQRYRPYTLMLVSYYPIHNACIR